MKRLLWWMIALGSFTSVYAQDPGMGEYEAQFDISIKDGNKNHHGECSNWFKIYLTITGQDEPTEPWWEEDLDDVDSEEAEWTHMSATMTFPANQRMTSVNIWAERQWHYLTVFDGWECKGPSGWNEFTPEYAHYLDGTYFGQFEGWDSELRLQIYPKAINLYYYNRSNRNETGGGKFYLPQAHPIQIKATQGFPSSVYNWQYQIGNDSWQNFPAALSGRSVLTFSGNDIPNINFANDVVLPRKSVKVRIRYACEIGDEIERYSDEISLIPMLSSPNILAVAATPPSCSYSNDGKLTVTLDRGLYPGETISFTMNRLPKGPENIAQLSAGNRFTLENFKSFSNETLSFIGRFNGDFTYTDDPTSHNRSVSVPTRTPVTFTATPFEVHCYNGEDGSIRVTAQGGTGTYTASLYQANTLLDSIPLTQAAGNSFLSLKSGTYTVKLKDSNNCQPRDANQQEITYVRTVDQPTQRVLVSTVENVEPLGFGLTNGYVSVRSQGGNSPYTFRWTDRQGNVLTAQPTQSEGASQKSTLSNLGKGTYRVRVEDARYGQAAPPTEANICGCYDTLTLVVDEPPLLRAALAEQHYVSCYGDADGELRSLATGGRPYAAGHPNAPYRYEWFRLGPNGPQPFGASDPLATQRPAGRYQVKVTDRNGITAWSSDFELRQPPQLTLRFNTSQLLCNGDRNGTALALPLGGTPPYRYTWSTEQTTAAIGQLTDGTYSAVVTDARGCMVLGQTEVKVPNSLAVAADLVHPLCYGEANGSIQLRVDGGKPPYQYQWDNGPQTKAIGQLPQGTYSVRITDANGCFITRQYELVQPDRPLLNPGGDRVLCRDQHLDLDVTITDPAAQYRWLKDGVPFSDRAAVRLTEAGTYQVRITNGQGCPNQAELRIRRDAAVVAAELVVATRVPKGERVRVANISHPAPERVEWLVPAGARILEEQIHSLDLSFETKGDYSVGLRGFMGACEKTMYKSVRVVDKSELPDYQTPNEPYIKRFMVSPNPNDGRFTATVELRESADFKLILYSGQANPVMEKEIKKQSFSQVDFQVPAPGGTGIYLLQLITAQGHAIYKVVVQ